MSDKALALLAALRLEDGSTWGSRATAVQWADAQAVLDQVSPVRRHWLSRARGYSKTSDLAGVTLVVMLAQLPPAAMAYAAASDRDQARLLLAAIRGFVTRTPELAGLVEVREHRVVVPSTGVQLEVMSADAASAYGLLPHWLVVDELCQWSDTAGAQEFFTALTTGLPKVASSRAVVISTPGDPAHWSRRVFDAASAESGLWRVSTVAGPPPWMEARLIEAERRRLLPSQFARLFMGEWAQGEDRLVDPDDLEACLVLDGPLPVVPAHRYVLTLDIGLTNDRTVAVVAHAEPCPDGDGLRVVVDRLHRWRGTRERPVALDDVAATVEALARAFGATVRYDPFQAALMAQQLTVRGVPVEEFTFTASSVGRVAGTLHSLIRSRNLALPDDEDLRAELLAVRLRTNSTGTIRLDHASGKHDDQAVAIGLAATVLLDEAGPSGPEAWYFPSEAVFEQVEQARGLGLGPAWARDLGLDVGGWS